jgi:hypothetical protein
VQSLHKDLGFKGFMRSSVHTVLGFRVLFTFLHVKVLGFAESHMKMWPKSLSSQLHKWTCSALP